MRKTIISSVIAVSLVCALPAQPAFAYKPTVAVYGFECKASSGFWHDAKWDIGTGMGEMLIDALVGLNQFEVVERLNIEDITTEQDLVTGGRVSKTTGARTGEMKGADYIVRGTITEFDYQESGGDLGLHIHGFNLGAKTSEAHIAGVIRIYDATTGEIYASERFEKKVPSTGLKVGYSHAGVGGSLGGFKETPLGQATAMAIKDMVQFVSSKIPSEPKAKTETVICPSCGTAVAKDVKFCTNCGAQLKDIVCPSCGKALPAGTNFCPHCGGQVKKSS